MSLQPVYLFLGPENGEKARETKRLHGEFAQASGGEIDHHVYYGFDDSLSQVLAEARSGSLFSSGSFIVFRSIEEIKGNEDSNALAAYLKNPPKDAVLVLESNETSSSRTAFLKKAATLIPKPAQKVFWEMFENQRQSWLIAYLRERGGHISPQAAEAFLDLVANNTEEMARECDKLLALHPEEGREISLEDVETYIFHSREESAYTVFAYLAEKNLIAALEAVNSILAQGEGQAIGLMAGLIRQFRALATIKAATPRGEPRQDQLKAAGIIFKRAQNTFLTACRNFRAQESARVLRAAGAYEFSLRELRSPSHKHLLHLFCYQAVHGADRALVDPPEDIDSIGPFGLYQDNMPVQL